MALRRLSTSSIQTNGKSSKLWDQTTFQSGMFALATVSLTSTQSTVSFTGIPSTYTHLQIRCLTQTTRATYGHDQFQAIFNGEATDTTNYTLHNFYGGGDGALASEAAFNTFRIGIGNTTTGNAPGGKTFGASVIDILDYASTSKYKTLKALTGGDLNGTVAGYPGFLGFHSGLWKNSSTAVNAVTFYVGSGASFATGTQFALYGIKTV